jgi:voltage-gated potassium channel
MHGGRRMQSPRIAERFQARVGLRPGHAARNEMLFFLRRIALLLGSVVALVLVGGAALAANEEVSYWRGVTWALDTVATIGSIPSPESVGGDVTTILLTIFGVGTMFFVLVTMTELFVAGDLSGLLDERRMQSKIAQLKDHYLICGYGRVGRQVAKDLRAGGVPFVVIDDNPDVREHAEEEDVLLIEGRGSDDETLLEAGIERACAVVACVDSDAENIFATLTARELRPDIPIVARAAVESSERKLVRAGANEVVSPYKASGRTMASLALAAPERAERNVRAAVAAEGAQASAASS